MRLQEQINQVITSTVIGMGYDLWELECVPCKKAPTIRIYIDKQPCVSVADCQLISRNISKILQVKMPFSNFCLEVSSPGLDRKLSSMEQYKQVINKTLQISLKNYINGRKNFKGTLLEINDTKLHIEIKEDGIDTLLIDIMEIMRARLVPEIDF